MLTQQMTAQILGLAEASEETKPWVEAFREQLRLDNNKLREHFVCRMFGYEPTNGYRGKADGFDPVTNTDIDVKTGGIFFPDGGNSIQNKLDWVCLVVEYDQLGLPIYVAEVPVSCIYEELQTSANDLKAKGGRVSPGCDWKAWVTKPEAKVIFKRPEAYPRTFKKGVVRKKYQAIEAMTYQNKLCCA